MSFSSAVVLHDVSFHWPDGTPVLSHVSGAFTAGRTGLVGANGTGKSTLLRLIAGDLSPTGGTLTTTGTVAVLRQDVTRAGGTLADLLGISTERAALRAVESGSVDPAHFDAIGDAWDVEERAVAELAANGLPTDLDRDIGTLSGGEAMLAAVIGVRLRAADVTLLDEPTNNLDRPTRRRLYELIETWRGTLIVVSHDLDLLNRLDATAELRDGALTVFGGPYDDYRAWLATRQEAARRAVRTAEQVLRRERRERIKAEERIAHSQRQGRKDRENRTFVPGVINDRRNSAEKSQGARRTAAAAKETAARQAVAAAEREVRDDDAVHVDLPDPQVPRGKRIAELPSADGRSSVIQGPERVALVGANGVGKTTLITTVLPQLPVRYGYLPQRIVLEEDATVLDVVRDACPHVRPGEVRNRLARLLVRGDMVDRRIGALSGGERFRVALARLLLTDPPPELLVFDEPTNDLDLPTVDQLVTALASYRGALLVVSHDVRFLQRLGLNRVLVLDAARRLTESDLSGVTVT